MSKRIRLILSFLLIGIFLNFPIMTNQHSSLNQSQLVYAEESEDESELDIQSKPPTDDTDELYKRYKDNSFNLMNKEFSSINKINQAMQNSFLTIKNFTFKGVIFIGKFNVIIVNSLFNLNIANAIKDPIQQMSLTISKNMLGVASTLGILAIAIFMIVKLISTGRTSEAMKVFGIGLFSFVVLTAYNNPTTNKYFFDGIIEVDNQIENAFAGINPQFKDNEKKTDNVGDKVSRDVFRTNIYEPFLYVNYGTTNVNSIRKEKVEYKGKKYDRIGAILDNDGSSEKQVKFVEEVTDYEVDTLKNNNPSYQQAGEQTFICLAYVLTNLVQTVIFGILGLLRLALQFLLIIIPLFLPIIMLVGMVLQGTSMLGDFTKGFLTISFLKASLSFITVVFTSYVSLAYTMNIKSNNILEIILTRLAWILAPVFIWKFRYLVGGLFSKKVRQIAGGLMNSLRHPKLASQLANKYRQNKAERKRKAREERNKKKKETPPNKKQQENKEKNKLNEVKPNKSDFKLNRNKSMPNQPPVNPEPIDKDDNKEKTDLNQSNTGEPSAESLQEKRRQMRSEVPNETADKQQVNQVSPSNKEEENKAEGRANRTATTNQANTSEHQTKQQMNRVAPSDKTKQEERGKQRANRVDPTKPNVTSDKDKKQAVNPTARKDRPQRRATLSEKPANGSVQSVGNKETMARKSEPIHNRTTASSRKNKPVATSQPTTVSPTKTSRVVQQMTTTNPSSPTKHTINRQTIPQKLNKPSGQTVTKGNKKTFKATPKREVAPKRETISKGKVNKKNANFYMPKKK